MDKQIALKTATFVDTVKLEIGAVIQQSTLKQVKCCELGDSVQ